MPQPRRVTKFKTPAGWEVLQALQPARPATLPSVLVRSDADVAAVKVELEELAGGSSQLVGALGLCIRRALDASYNGTATGRFHLAQLSKTEKAHTGTLLEVEIQNRLGLPDGHATDYQVLQFDVDAKFTHAGQGGPSWMIGPEILGNIALLVTADDYRARWSAWLVWVTLDRLNRGQNRDSKASLSVAGRSQRVPIAVDSALPVNNLLANPDDAVAVMEFSGYGNRRIKELCRRFDGHLLSRTTIETVAQQLDPMKRMRSDGGARDLLPEGILILGAEAEWSRIARALALPAPQKGQFLPVRVVLAEPRTSAPVLMDDRGVAWRRARPGEPSSPDSPTLAALVKSGAR